MAKAEYVSYWYSALASEFGVVVWSDNPDALKQRLYAARREAMDPALESLSIVVSPTNPEHLWIVKNAPKG